MNRFRLAAGGGGGGAPAAALQVVHKVADFGKWKPVFDEHETARRKAGIFGHHLARAAGDENTVSIYLPGPSIDALKGFIADPGLKDAMMKAGVVGAPTFNFFLPREDRAVKQGGLGAMIVAQEVEDYAQWKRVFDKHADIREKAGIIGYAVNSAAENPNFVVVFTQAKSVESLKAFSQSPELKERMKEAGGKGPPAFTFLNSVEWKMY